ncbi:hypothetical protein GGI07_003058 [Coemansia sp. Benny D115]|nr:hypothetical protein GGI07_003058 [Coemansia sp. Benny D115]
MQIKTGEIHDTRHFEAANALQHLLEAGALIETQLASTEPQHILLPDTSLVTNPSLTYTSSTIVTQAWGPVCIRLVQTVTRPQILSRLCALVHRGFQRQLAMSVNSRGPLIRRGQLRTRAPGLYLQGCKGIGKSHILMLLAAHLLVSGNRGIRVLYISDCSQWTSCTTTAERTLFLIRAIAAAFMDSDDVQRIISEWHSQATGVTSGLWRPTVVSLLEEINTFCEREQLKVAVLVDNVDSIVGSGSSGTEVLGLLRLINSQTRSMLVVAAQDDAKGMAASDSLSTAAFPIRTPFNSMEAALFVRSYSILQKTQAWQIKDILNKTWRHPGELKRLCDQITAALKKTPSVFSYEDIVCKELQVFTSLPFIRFVPRPFSHQRQISQQMQNELVGRSVLHVLSMSRTTPAMVDVNYMNVISKSTGSFYVFPSPQVAKSIVNQYCRAKVTQSDVDMQLGTMRMALFKTFG